MRLMPPGMLLLAAAVLGGCASSRETGFAADPPDLAALRQRLAALPSKVVMAPAGEMAGHPLKLAIHEVGTGTHDRIIVLVHGLLTDQRVWRYLGGALGADYDLMMVELPGCGQSDKPDPAQVGDEAYSPRSMARNVLAAVRKQLRGREELRGRLAAGADHPKVALLGHSLGAAVVLSMVSDADWKSEFADVLAPVDRVVLLAPPDAATVRPDPTFTQVRDMSDTEACLGEFFGVIEGRVTRALLGREAEPTQLPLEEARNIADVLLDPARRHAAQAMIRQAAPSHAFHPDWSAIEKAEAGYRAIAAPVLIVWGARDELLPVAMGYKLQAQIPGCTLRIVARTGHFLPSECPARVAGLVREFILSGGKRMPAIQTVEPQIDATPLPSKG